MISRVAWTGSQWPRAKGWFSGSRYQNRCRYQRRYLIFVDGKVVRGKGSEVATSDHVFLENDSFCALCAISGGVLRFCLLGLLTTSLLTTNGWFSSSNVAAARKDFLCDLCVLSGKRFSMGS